MILRSLLILIAAMLVALAPGAGAAERRVEVRPYLQVDQTVFDDFKTRGGALSYTTLSAGLDARVQTRRVEVQIDYRFDYRIGWSGRQGNSDTHSGVARAKIIAIPRLLNIEAGALATRTRSDIRGDAPNAFIGNPGNVSQLYSVYAGPTLSTRVGAFDVTGAYRLGYTKVEAATNGITISGQPLIDRFDDSLNHVGLLSIGMRSGLLPFAWTVSAGYEREDARQLDQRFEGKHVRGDVTVPIAPTVALVAGIGYEDIMASQRDALRDAGGNPIVDGAGRFVTDPATPRRLSYDQSGFIWDAGVVWRPSRRTSAEVRIGRRYGGMTYTGSVSYTMNESLAFNAVLYDGIQTFGRQLNNSLARLPTQFTVARNPFGGTAGGCVYSVAGGGGCLDAALQSVATGTYRSRGLGAVISYQRGRTTAGIGGGYATRRFFAPASAFFSTDGVTDDSLYLQAYAAYRLDQVSSVTGSVYANLFQSGIGGAPDVLGTGATGAYYRRLGGHVTGNIALGLFSNRVEGVASSLIGSALIGGRYEF